MERLTIEYPQDLLFALGTTTGQFEEEAKFLLAAKLFDLGRLSSGAAARLAGMERVTFLLSLPRAGVDAIQLDDSDLQSDLQYARLP